MELHPTTGITAAVTPLADQHKRVRNVMMPPLNRTSMAPRPWRGTRAGSAKGSASDTLAPSVQAKWHHTAARRRITLCSLVLAQTWLATHFMASVLPYQGRQLVEIAIL